MHLLDCPNVPKTIQCTLQVISSLSDINCIVCRAQSIQCRFWRSNGAILNSYILLSSLKSEDNERYDSVCSHSQHLGEGKRAVKARTNPHSQVSWLGSAACFSSLVAPSFLSPWLSSGPVTGLPGKGWARFSTATWPASHLHSPSYLAGSGQPWPLLPCWFPMSSQDF